MRGLKTQESDKFNRFFLLIQEAAEMERAVFFAFAGEGNDFETKDIEGENMSGWLIPDNQVDAFEPMWDADNSMENLEQWQNFLVWVNWHRSRDTVSVEFEHI